MGSRLTEEQAAFAAAVRDFAKRECGTREQRDALTDGDREAHHKATELAKRAALEGMQMMGGYGYTTEFDMERPLRAAAVSTVYGGTSEIQRDVIGKTYGL